MGCLGQVPRAGDKGPCLFSEVSASQGATASPPSLPRASHVFPGGSASRPPQVPPGSGRAAPESHPGTLETGRAAPESHPGSLETGRATPESHPGSLETGRAAPESHPGSLETGLGLLSLTLALIPLEGWLALCHLLSAQDSLNSREEGLQSGLRRTSWVGLTCFHRSSVYQPLLPARSVPAPLLKHPRWLLQLMWRRRLH